MEARKTRWVGIGFLLLLSGVFLFNLYRERDRALWDFKTYYHAAQTFRSGGDPYDLSALSESAGEEITLPFLYPPSTLVVFLPLTLVGFPTAFTLYFAIKIVSVAFLLGIWRTFLRDRFDLLFLPFAVVVFNSAIPLDIAAGNISSFEQILLWSGFLFYLRGSLLPFSALVLLASLFKATPLFFLILLFFSSDSQRYFFLVGTSILFLAIHCSGHLFYPDLMSGYSFGVDRILGDQESRGLWNPSTFALVRDLFYEGASAFERQIGMRAPFAVYLFIAIACLALTLRGLKASQFSETDSQVERDSYRICLLSLLYVLIVPRLQIYSYLAVIPSTFYFLKRWTGASVYPITLFFVMSLSARDVLFPGMEEFYSFFWDYSPLIVVGIIWAAEIVSDRHGCGLNGTIP